MEWMDPYPTHPTNGSSVNVMPVKKERKGHLNAEYGVRERIRSSPLAPLLFAISSRRAERKSKSTVSEKVYTIMDLALRIQA
jgi:hypothetical protein